LGVNKVDVLVNGQPALTLSREDSGRLFTATLAKPCHPVLVAAFASMAKFSSLFGLWEEFFPQGFQSYEEQRRVIAAAVLSFNDWERGLDSGSFEQMRGEADVAAMQVAYERALLDREFFLDGFVLRDNDEYDEWCSPGWREEILQDWHGLLQY
jgi:hypothetical protein